MRQTKNEELMAAGVTIIDPATTYVHPDVTVGADTVLHPNVHLEGHTAIGAACEIHSGTRIVDSTLGDRVTVRNYCIVTESSVSAEAVLGPFAHLRPASDVKEGAHVGNFVELKKTTLGAGSKANHLAYLGDATIGDGVNVGAGVITCNYDGTKKHPTVIRTALSSEATPRSSPRDDRRGRLRRGRIDDHRGRSGRALGIARGRQVNKRAGQRRNGKCEVEMLNAKWNSLPVHCPLVLHFTLQFALSI